uniref:zinc finger protein 644-like n=1 Tax=Oncorhynchus gorbuscha TaxID=8017 RepID=UPI001EAF46BF|nr:zinc finger protein 644-like [Oncorhynchus gorbuscha]XP_046157600.1 zinc finger protein 644-like [Oncorhynchus gorbuscha]XP_046157601.1 zinc finger protein 644-like [Oncorhynchus gorbuscha]
MADIKPNAQEDKEGDVVEPLCNSSVATQEPLQRHTSSLKNNAARLTEQLSSDRLSNPLNGAQPSPIVPSSVPAVPHTAQTAHSLPFVALVNGPASHPNSEESCGLNKDSTTPNNVLVEAQDTQLWQAGRDTSPQVLPPPSELQSDALKNPAGPGPVLKTLATTQPEANNTSPSDSGESEAELPYQARDTTLSDHSPQPHQTPINQIWTAERVKARARSIWDLHTTESSESSSDGSDGADSLHWDSQKELIRVLWNNRNVDNSLQENTAGVGVMPQLTSQRQRKRKIHLVGTSGSPEKVYNSSSNHTYKKWHIEEEEDDDEDFDIANVNDEDFPCKKADVQSSVNSCQEHPSDSPVIIKKLIIRADCHEDNHSDSLFSRKPKQLKTEQSEQEPSFFPCTKCNVNFKEKRHLHRHMMYHLDGHNHQIRHHENVPRPFICRECGRSFRDRNSLLKHMIIHQERREKLMEEIQGLNKLRDEGRNAKLQCPQCVFGTNCPKTFVQHAKTHEKDKRYYCCEECNHMALTERELEAHLYAVHCDTLQYKYKNMIKDEESEFPTNNNEDNESRSVVFHCKVCPFSTQNQNDLKSHCDLIHQFCEDECDSPPFNKASDHQDQYRLAGPSKKADLNLLQLKQKFYIKKPAFWKRADLPFWSSSVADFYTRNKADAQKYYKDLTASQFKCSIGSSTKKLSPSMWRSDKPNKLSPKPTEKIDVTTGLPYVEEENQQYDHVISGISERTKYPSNVDVLVTSKMAKIGQMLNHSYDSDKSQGDSNDLTCRKSESQAVTRKSPSKRKMSTPFRNTVDKVVDNVFPKLNPKLRETTTPEDTEDDDYEDTYDFSAYTSEATANFLDSSENERNPYARSYFIRRQRGSFVKEDPAPAADVGHFEKNATQADHHFEKTEVKEGEYDSDDIQKLIIKEECIESSVCDDSPESPTTTKTHNQSLSYEYDVSPPCGSERKSCPYCPAVFESGVGLSNHVRGHLHRVGLSYDARHVVSPEQVASQDRQPRIRRKIPSVARRIKKAEKPESQAEHTCPLCCGWFDTNTGLSNHVRGHLKRIGKTSTTSTSKSPVCILNELLQDEQEHQNIFQTLNRKQFLSRPIISQKFIGSDGLFLTPTGFPVKIQHGCQPGKDGNSTSWGPSATTPRQEEVKGEELFSERKSIEIRGVREPSQGTLVELLRKKKLDKEQGQLRDNSRSYDADRNHFTVTKERFEERQNQQASNLEPHWAQERNESNKKMCIHCNTTFPSAVSLSNHLRAYARRKTIAMMEGTTYSCIQKKRRLRAGPKKKLFSALPPAVEEMYRLTCRFCDLVFQGPLSIQEDWIKHLQRHLMHTSVPHTGAGMVEVLGLHKEISSFPPQQHPCLEHPMSKLHPTAHEPLEHHGHPCLEHPETHEHPEPHDEHPLHYAYPSSNEHPSLEQHTATPPPELLPVAS